MNPNMTNFSSSGAGIGRGEADAAPFPGPMPVFSTVQAVQGMDGTESDREALLRAIETSPNDVWPYYALGADYMRQGNAAASVAQFTRCLSMDSRFVPARLQLAGIYYEQGNYAACIAEYRIAIRNGGVNDELLADLYFGMGDAYRAYGDWEQAIESYRQALNVVELAFDRVRHRPI